jgi:PAS domain S-box-containing protein
LARLELLKTALEHAGESIVITDVNGTILWVNPAFTATTGYTAEEAVGQNPRILKSGLHPREFYERFWSHILAGRVWRGIFVNRRKDGTLYYDERTIAPVFDAEGRITHFVSVGEDVTERIRAQESLRRHERHLAAQNRILTAILEAADLDERLNRVLDAALEALEVEIGGLWLVEGDRLVLRAWRGMSDEFRAYVQAFRVAEAPDWMREAQVVHERLSETGRIAEFAKREGIQARASMPLTLPTGEWLGVLVLGSRRYEALPEEDISFYAPMGQQIALAIWHAQLRRSAEERLRRLTILRRIDQAIIQKLNLREVLDAILEGVPAEMGADAVAVSLLDETQSRFQVFLMRLPNGRIVEEPAFEVAESLLHWFVERQEPVVIYDIHQDPRLQTHREVLRDDRLFSYLGVPLVVQGETIGVLHMFTTTPRVFSDEDVSFFRTLAGQAAIAIANARLFYEARLRLRSAERTLAAQIRIALLAPEEVPERVLEELQATLGVRHADFYEYDESAGVLRLRACVGFTADRLAAVTAEPSSTVRLGEGLIGQVAAERRSVYVPDTAREPRWQGFAYDAGRPFQSVYLVPVGFGDRLFGVIVLMADEPGAFPALQREMIDNFAGYVGASLEIVRLLAEVRRRADQLERAYEDLKQAQEALLQQERLRALGQMASGIVHDINNALVPIVGYAELLGRHWDEQVREQARWLSKAAADVTHVVERLRSFYRPRGPEEALEMVDLNAAVRQVVELTRPRWYDMPQREGVTIEVTTDLAEDLPPTAAVGAEVREALTNLVFNAVDAVLAKGEPWGRIVLRTRQAGEWAVVEVTDTGIGMDEEVRRRAVEPFFTTKGAQGSGLGLAMVYGTMRRHDGDLELESEPGRGTTVRLIFPIRRVEWRTEVEEPEVPTVSRRVLLIDDDPRVRQVLGAMLQEMGHRVTVAGGGVEGLTLFEAALQAGDPYDLVLTDLGMPGMTGSELVRRLKATSPATPVVVLTGWGQEAKPREADAALGKPVTWRELRALLAKLLPPPVWVKIIDETKVRCRRRWRRTDTEPHIKAKQSPHVDFLLLPTTLRRSIFWPLVCGWLTPGMSPEYTHAGLEGSRCGASTNDQQTVVAFWLRPHGRGACCGHRRRAHCTLP